MNKDYVEALQETIKVLLLNAEEDPNGMYWRVPWDDLHALCRLTDTCPTCLGSKHAGIGAGCQDCHSTGEKEDQNNDTH